MKHFEGGDQVSQEKFAPGKSLLTGTSHLFHVVQVASRKIFSVTFLGQQCSYLTHG